MRAIRIKVSVVNNNIYTLPKALNIATHRLKVVPPQGYKTTEIVHMARHTLGHTDVHTTGKDLISYREVKILMQPLTPR